MPGQAARPHARLWWRRPSRTLASGVPTSAKGRPLDSALFSLPPSVRQWRPTVVRQWFDTSPTGPTARAQKKSRAAERPPNPRNRQHEFHFQHTERYFSALRTDGTTPQYIRDQESHHAVLLASGMAWGGSSTTLFRSLSALSQVSCNTSHAWCMRKAASVHTVRARLLGSGSSGRLRQGRARANMHQRHTHSQRGPARAPHC